MCINDAAWPQENAQAAASYRPGWDLEELEEGEMGPRAWAGALLHEWRQQDLNPTHDRHMYPTYEAPSLPPQVPPRPRQARSLPLLVRSPVPRL
jgi:hypothetical protein